VWDCPHGLNSRQTHTEITSTPLSYSTCCIFVSHCSLQKCSVAMCLEQFSVFLRTAVVETYELSGKHTYLSMAIFTVCVAVVLLSLIPLYRQLAPRSVVQEEQYYMTAPFTSKDEKELGTEDWDGAFISFCSKNCCLRISTFCT